MLSGVVEWMSEEGWHVSVIGRTERKMRHLLKCGNVTPLYVDYNDTDDLEDKIEATVSANGEISIVVAWIHSTARGTLHTITNTVTGYYRPIDLHHVIGSATRLEEIRDRISAPRNCYYYQIQLGFIKEQKNSRWLTNDEIAEGVIESIRRKRKTHIVGALEPWEGRP